MGLEFLHGPSLLNLSPGCPFSSSRVFLVLLILGLGNRHRRSIGRATEWKPAKESSCGERNRERSNLSVFFSESCLLSETDRFSFLSLDLPLDFGIFIYVRPANLQPDPFSLLDDSHLFSVISFPLSAELLYPAPFAIDWTGLKDRSMINKFFYFSLTLPREWNEPTNFLRGNRNFAISLLFSVRRKSSKNLSPYLFPFDLFRSPRNSL